MAGRNFDIKLVQAGTNKTLTISVSQADPNYVFRSNITTLSPTQAGGAYDVVITSTRDGNSIGWTIGSKPSWVTADSTNPTKFTISRNTEARDRTGTIVLKQNESGNTISITISKQAGVPVYVFDVNPNSYAFGANGGTYDMVIKSTKTYNDAVTPMTYTVTKNSGGSAKITNSNNKVTASAATSYTDIERATFTLKQSESNRTLTFTATLAKKADVVTSIAINKLAPSTSTIPYTGSGAGGLRVEVKATWASGKVTTETANATYTPSNATATSTKGSFTVPANPTYANRTIKITASYGGKSNSLTITQGAKPDDGVFTANPRSLSFTGSGGTKTSTITSTSKGQTVGWTVSNKSSLPSWISVSGEGTGTLSITTKENL